MAHSIYAGELTSLGHGHPLWEPDCQPEVSIADVGYVRYGQFCRLFNASLPPGDPGNIYGEPDGYEPLHIGAIQRRAAHPPGAMVSRSVSKKGVDMELSASIIQAGGAGFSFSCKKDRGAVLIINSEAHREDALRLGAFKTYMIQHYKSWLNLANNGANDRDILLSDLVFVTGRDNTADWAVATFSERTTSGEVSFEAGYPAIAGAKFSIWGSWGQARSVHSHCGPQIPHDGSAITSTENSAYPVCAADLQKYNQCVFLRGYKILDRKAQARKKIGLKVSGSSSGLEEIQEPWFQRTSSSDFSDASSVNKSRSSSNGSSWGKQRAQLTYSSRLEDRNASDAEIVSNDPQDSAPLESLLWYILENSKARIAVAHDDDLARFTKDDDESLDFTAMHIYVDSEGVGTISDDGAPRFPMTDSPPMVETPIPQSPTGSVVFSPAIPADTQRAPSPDILVKPGYKPEGFTRKSSAYRSPVKRTNTVASGKPDSAAYYEEQERIRSEIGALQVQLSAVQDEVSLISKTGRGADRRNTLRAELDTLRDQKLASKRSEGPMTSELKTLQDETRKKIKDRQAMSKKLTGRSVEDLDLQIRALQRKVDTGTMGPAVEKKTLGQINSLSRSRAAIESYQTLQTAIDADRTRADALRKQLDTESKTISDRFDAVRAELELLRRKSDEAFANRSQLYDERNKLQAQISDLHEQKQQSVERFREERESYRQGIDEERARQAQRAREEKSAQEEQRRIQAHERLLEKARAPAFAAEIHDCRGLLEYFAGLSKMELRASSRGVSPTEEVFHQAKHQPRQAIENHPGAGWVPLKKKTEEDAYFVGGKGKAKKGQRRGAAPNSTSSTKISVSLDILSTLLSLSIAPPSVAADIPRTIEDLRKKIEWFEDNQRRVTEENVARMEADLQRIAPHARNNVVAITT